jgi:hypothetical protein
LALALLPVVRLAVVRLSMLGPRASFTDIVGSTA